MQPLIIAVSSEYQDEKLLEKISSYGFSSIYEQLQVSHIISEIIPQLMERKNSKSNKKEILNKISGGLKVIKEDIANFKSFSASEKNSKELPRQSSND